MRRLLLLTFAAVISIAECSEDGKSEKEPRTIYSKETQNASEILKIILHDGYDKNTRPYIAVKPLVIHVQIAVSSISQISEENMEFQCTMYFRQRWHDPRLAFGDDNVTVIILEGEALEKIWLPDTYIDNARKSSVLKRTAAAILFANGTVFYSYRILRAAEKMQRDSEHGGRMLVAWADRTKTRISSTLGSSMNFVNYPMDDQMLHITMLSYLQDDTKIILRWLGGSILKQELTTYVLSSVTLKRKSQQFLTGSYSTLVFQFEIHRRLGYFLMQFYFPCVLCVSVSWLPFWMDRYEIGDRVSLGITTLLTEVFLSQYINSAMPRVSYIKAADEFLLSSFVFIMMALIESVVVYNFREDVRKKRKWHQLSRQKKSQVLRNGSTKEFDSDRIESIKEFDNPAFAYNEVPFSVANVFRAKFLDEDKSKDLGLKVDNISRVAFPVIYLLFVSYYFGRYALYHKLISN